MAQNTVESIIRKAVSDETFRSLLLHNPGEALAAYDLTDQEHAQLCALDPNLFQDCNLEERVSRAMRGGGWDAN